MLNYWETLFKEGGALWKFEPSDSAHLALNMFKENHLNSILIPWFGYGRNAKLFIEAGFRVTGIEIAQSAIDLAKANGLDCTVHQGSVIAMPFDTSQYDGIFCYALIHLLNKTERRNFLKACYHQLKPGGFMVFTVVSKQANIYGEGTKISKDRYRMLNGLSVYFYDSVTVRKEFTDFGLIEYMDFEEPIKFMEGQDPLKCLLLICKKE
ncbi:MAG: class I SAM-dependent methyltransferase [Salinivirgaceae bacterium]